MRISSRLGLFAVDVKHKRYLIRTSDPLRVYFETNVRTDIQNVGSRKPAV